MHQAGRDHSLAPPSPGTKAGPHTITSFPRLGRQRWPTTQTQTEHLLSVSRKGSTRGFRIGFQRQAKLKPATSNMQSARDHPEVVKRYITEELSKGHLSWTHSSQASSNPRIKAGGLWSSRKVITLGSERLITDLSFPEGHSVNDGIYSDLCSLKHKSWMQWQIYCSHTGKRGPAGQTRC